MKPRLVLHIGCHKTGTTSIQAALAAQTSTLREQGVLYPLWDTDLRARKQASLIGLHRQLDQPAGVAWIDQLAQQIRVPQAHTVILSEERLWVALTQEPLITALRPHFSRIDVIAMLRRQDLYLESMHAENLKSLNPPVRGSVLDFAHSAEGRRRMNFAAVLDGWAALVDSVRAVDFSQAARGGRLLSSFCELAQLPADVLAPTDAIANVTPDIELMLVLQQLRARGHDTAWQMLQQAAAAVPLPSRLPGAERWLSLADRHALLQSHAASNAQLAERWQVHFDQEMPASPARTRDQPDPGYLVDVLDAVCRKLRWTQRQAAQQRQEPAPADAPPS